MVAALKISEIGQYKTETSFEFYIANFFDFFVALIAHFPTSLVNRKMRIVRSGKRPT